MSTTSPLSWEAKAGPRGRYCAPACGRGCTRVEHDRAQRAAAALCRRLGKPWTPRVWENLGWHYEAVVPGATISPDHVGGFVAYVVQRYVEHGPTPQQALVNALRPALREARALLQVLEAIPSPKPEPKRRRRS